MSRPAAAPPRKSLRFTGFSFAVHCSCATRRGKPRLRIRIRALARRSGLTRGRTLPDAAHLVQGPVNEDGLPVDVLARHVTPHPAVARLAAMVAEHEVTARGNDLLLAIAPRPIVAFLGGDVVFRQRDPIHVDLSAVDA